MVAVGSAFLVHESAFHDDPISFHHFEGWSLELDLKVEQTELPVQILPLISALFWRREQPLAVSSYLVA
jgi:hypothetical protein